MKMPVFFNLLLFLIISFGCSKDAPENMEYDVSIMSFNIRYDTEDDGENKWNNRKKACIEMLNTEKPGVFGIQEGLAHQVDYINTEMPDYHFVGVGRDDGAQDGEFNAVFYSTVQFELQDSGTFWLSESSETCSYGWDAVCRRIVTWVKLKDLDHDQIIFVFNTHFDHKGKEAREESAKLLVEKIEEITDEQNPVFITGDFNALYSNSILVPIKESFENTQKNAEYSDGKNSFNSFGKNPIRTNIDFIFYRNVQALSFKTIDDDYGVPYISDHYPLIGHYLYQ